MTRSTRATLFLCLSALAAGAFAHATGVPSTLHRSAEATVQPGRTSAPQHATVPLIGTGLIGLIGLGARRRRIRDGE